MIFAARKHKFNAKRTEVDGVSFASKLEAHRYQQLKLMERVKAIECLHIQPRFPLKGVLGAKVCTYVADFDYIITETRQYVVEDVKGMLTDVFKIKAALFHQQYGIPVTVVTKKDLSLRRAQL